MKNTKRKFTAKFKSKVAIEAIQEKLTIQQIAAKYEVHPNQFSQWRRQFLDNAESVFVLLRNPLRNLYLKKSKISSTRRSGGFR